MLRGSAACLRAHDKLDAFADAPNQQDAIIRVMQYVGRRYVLYFNHKYGRTGTSWEGRYKGSRVQDEQYLLICMRYIGLNPVRANMVKSPTHYGGKATGIVPRIRRRRA